MNKGDLLKIIQEELQSLNREIDYKIIKGFSYSQESKRHKFLTKQLKDLTAPVQSTLWFTRASKFVSTFIF
jgi:hypothetical protein